MANYFARIELHNAKWPEDYRSLHDKLAKESFFPQITGSAGANNLPPACYYAEGRTDDFALVTEVLKKIADGTGHKSKVFCIKNPDWRGYLTDF